LIAEEVKGITMIADLELEMKATGVVIVSQSSTTGVAIIEIWMGEIVSGRTEITIQTCEEQAG